MFYLYSRECISHAAYPNFYMSIINCETPKKPSRYSSKHNSRAKVRLVTQDM